MIDHRIGTALSRGVIYYNPWWHIIITTTIYAASIEEQTKNDRCGWFSTIHLRLRLCSVRSASEECTVPAIIMLMPSSRRGFVTLVPSANNIMNPRESQRGHVESTSTRMRWCIISKGGDDGRDRLRITITWRLDIYFACGYKDRWNLIHLIRPQTRPSNTRNNIKE